MDHDLSARRARRWGWWYFAQARMTAEIPFVGSFLAVALGNPIMYLAAMGVGLGAIVRQPIDGVAYLTFVAPGLLVATVASTGASFGTWPIMGGFMWERRYYAAAATPVSASDLALGETTALGLRLIAQAGAFWLLGLLFGAWSTVASLWMVPIAVLAGLAFFTPLAAYAATIEQEGSHFQLIQRLVIMPMFLFAGTFFPLASMPGYLQWVGWVSPMWHGTQLARVASYGLKLDAAAVVGHAAVLLGCVLVGQWAMNRTFARRIEKAS